MRHVRFKDDCSKVIGAPAERIRKRSKICKGKVYIWYELRVSSDYTFKKLIGLGLRPNKSNLDLPFPDVPPEYLSHFVRGYFDGDGGFSNRRRNDTGNYKNQLYFCGSKKFIISLEAVIRENVGLDIKRIYEGDSVYTLRYDFIDVICKIRDWMYRDSDGLFLSRKNHLLYNYLS